MKRKELIEAIAVKTGMSRKDTGLVVNAMLEEIVDTVARGEAVKLMGFGTFDARKRAAKVGMNPRTGETVRIPETTIPAFKAGKAFKDAMK